MQTCAHIHVRSVNPTSHTMGQRAVYRGVPNKSHFTRPSKSSCVCVHPSSPSRVSPGFSVPDGSRATERNSVAVFSRGLTCLVPENPPGPMTGSTASLRRRLREEQQRAAKAVPLPCSVTRWGVEALLFGLQEAHTGLLTCFVVVASIQKWMYIDRA